MSTTQDPTPRVKDPQIYVPVSVEDKALLDRAAASKRLPLASWARMILVEAAQAEVAGA